MYVFQSKSFGSCASSAAITLLTPVPLLAPCPCSNDPQLASMYQTGLYMLSEQVAVGAERVLLASRGVKFG